MEIPSQYEYDPENPDEKVLYWASVTLASYIRNGQFNKNMWEQLNG